MNNIFVILLLTLDKRFEKTDLLKTSAPHPTHSFPMLCMKNHMFIMV